MNLKDQIDRELARLASLGGTGSIGEILSVGSIAGRLECELTAVDAIGCSFTSFAFKTDRLANATFDRLQKICDALAARLRYLLEPIALIESDAGQCVLQMRSQPPQQDEHATSYYELVVRRGGELNLRRYAKPRGSARQTIPAHVTKEVFCRLAADFEGAVS